MGLFSASRPATAFNPFFSRLSWRTSSGQLTHSPAAARGLRLAGLQGFQRSAHGCLPTRTPTHAGLPLSPRPRSAPGPQRLTPPGAGPTNFRSHFPDQPPPLTTATRSRGYRWEACEGTGQPESPDPRPRGYPRGCSVTGHRGRGPVPRVRVPHHRPGGRPQGCRRDPERWALACGPQVWTPGLPRSLGCARVPVRDRCRGVTNGLPWAVRGRGGPRTAFYTQSGRYPGASGGCGRGRGSTTSAGGRREGPGSCGGVPGAGSLEALPAQSSRARVCP